MKSRALAILLFILLVISLFVNGILGTLLYRSMMSLNHNVHFYTPPEPGEGRLGRGGFNPREYDDPKIRELRRNFLDTKRELMQELAKDPIDEAKVNAIIDRTVSAQGEMERALGIKLLEYRKTLSPEEAQRHFSEIMERQDRYNSRRNSK